MPAGPPPTTSTSVSAATSACRGSSVQNSWFAGRDRTGMRGSLRANAPLAAVARRALLEQVDRQPMRAPRALLERRQPLGDMRAHRLPQVPALVEVGDQPTGIDQLQRRGRDVERLEEARDL